MHTHTHAHFQEYCLHTYMPTHAYTHTHWRLVQYPLLAGYIQIGLDWYHLSPDHPLRAVINSYHARTRTHIHTHTHTHTRTRAHTHTDVYTHTHTCVQTHTHTQ